MENKEILGCGVAFPFEVNAATGRVVLSSGEKSVRESIYLILMTQKGERIPRPEFGSGILSYTFTDTSPTRLYMIARELEQVIREQEMRIADVNVQIQFEQDSDCLMISIDYRIAKTNQPGNLVFPFFLYSRQTEGEER